MKSEIEKIKRKVESAEVLMLKAENRISELANLFSYDGFEKVGNPECSYAHGEIFLIVEVDNIRYELPINIAIETFAECGVISINDFNIPKV